ncbi:TonB-dependent siderophore receptor [Ramlibacter monticola]|uniref:TonB-dependent siderophore receptor n=1 Tax=Ramlibacter monticola TaxID=1926872 RepID=A0A937CSE5_9BURK|nr:TonB-dependent siderophore receptor [Ramlibacter monticola]MBL0390002.1 TonB-dependent siderophore receptor [Ramlibacter monticola]
MALLGLCVLPRVQAQADVSAQAGGRKEPTLPTVKVGNGNEDPGFAPGANSLGRLPADPMDTPQSITVITKPLMESQGATSLASALRNVPGLTIGAAEGGQIGTNINLNGFSARTDIYLDGMRDRAQYYRDTFALDSVEVLMGPSSVLFGRGSTGGVINQVAKKPTLAAFGEVTATVTSNGLLRSTLDLNRPLGETSAFRIAAMAQDGDATNRQQNELHDIGIAPSLAWGMGTPTQITASALLQHNRDMADYGLPPLNGAPAPVNRDTAYGFTDDRTRSDVGTLGLTIRHKLSPTSKLRNQTQYNDVRTNAIETAPQIIGTRPGGGAFVPLSTGTPTAPQSPASNLPLGELFVRQQSHDRTIRDKSLFNLTEFESEWRHGDYRHDLLVGLELGADYYRNQNYFRNGSCGGVPLNPPGGTNGFVACTPLVDPPQVPSPANAPQAIGNLASGDARTVAVFVNDLLSIGEHWKLDGGLRYDHFDASIENSRPSATQSASQSQTVHFTSVRAGVIYQPTPEQSLYASYSTSFNPSLEQLVATTGTTDPLPPQRSRAYELGVKWEALGGKLSTGVAVFRITQYNARSQNNDGTFTATGTVQVNGFRAGASGNVTRQLQVFAAYTYLNAEIVDGIAPATQGRTPLNTPRQAANLWVTYAITPEWEIGGGANFVDGRFANNTNTVRVPAYTRFDALIAYHQPRYDIRLNLLNLGDKHYFDALIPSDGGRSVPGMARAAMLSMNYRF